METVTLVAPDMHCDGCAASIRQTLGRVEGIDSIEIDVARKAVTVNYDAAKIGIDAIRTRLDDAGFPVEA
ncbi:MAG: heavy-metal-associated domain-containing protein [Chthonomonadales bacterium]|nr:heavy-metal-associated domain-containing protein [Chthonomonadales bacterium]